MKNLIFRYPNIVPITCMAFSVLFTLWAYQTLRPKYLPTITEQVIMTQVAPLASEIGE